jgi:pimeloyl-ACP methyl ester carboxylesterase
VRGERRQLSEIGGDGARTVHQLVPLHDLNDRFPLLGDSRIEFLSGKQEVAPADTADHFGPNSMHPITGNDPKLEMRPVLENGVGYREQAPSWIPQIQAKGMRAFLAETIADRLPLDKVDPGLVECFLDEAAKNDPAYIGKFVLLMANYDWSDQLGHIRCPTLVVVPGAEPIGSTANYEPFRRHVKDVEMRVYEGAPHNICDAFPDRCAGDVLDFLGCRFGLGR